MRLKKAPKASFQVVERKSIFRGRRIALEVLRIQTQDSRSVERELVRHPGASVIIPRLPDGRLLLIRQLRVATGKWIWEFPAGTLEKGESPLACARRELVEETGWSARRWRKLLEFYPTPGISTEKMHLFVADTLHKVRGSKRDVDEEIETRHFFPNQVDRMIRERRIIDGKTILGFLFFNTVFQKENLVPA